jgi:hypothetical protein
MTTRRLTGMILPDRARPMGPGEVPDELITKHQTRREAVVGMSMGPALWIVSFALIYTLNPTLAADMPAKWAPIPSAVVQAIHGAGGRVPYNQVASYFH